MSSSQTKRGKILGIVRTVLLAVIAVSLVKLTFFPSGGVDEVQSLDPSAQYTSITVRPEKATITNSINLQGTIQADQPATIKATKAGEVTEIYVKDGATVNAGDTMMLIQKEMQTEPEEYTDAEGNPQMTKPQKYYENEWVTAPAAGKVNLSALVSQMVNVGDSLGTIQPPTFSAVATLSPDQMYRVQNMPEKALITIKNGPAPFECVGVRIDTPNNRQTQPGGDSSQQQSTSIEARCSIASDQKVFAGLQVTMGLVAGEAKDVLTIPVSAVEGRFEAGFVYKPAEGGGEPVKVPVKLGITDGKRIQVLEGLTENDEILEFIPGKKVEQNEGAFGSGGMMGMGEGAPASEEDAALTEEVTKEK